MKLDFGSPHKYASECMKSHVTIHFQKEEKTLNYIVFCHIQFAQQRKTHEYQQ